MPLPKGTKKVTSPVMASVLSAVFAAVLSAALATAAQAGPVADSAKAIETKLAANDFGGALDAARDILAQVWDQSPGLTFTQSLLVAENATGYGVYNPRADNVFKSGAPILIYCEPLGFGYGTPGEGQIGRADV